MHTLEIKFTTDAVNSFNGFMWSGADRSKAVYHTLEMMQ